MCKFFRRKAWFTIDLGVYLIPTAYTLRHARGYVRTALRSWLFQVSKDGSDWTTLMVHSDESRLNEPGSTATWPVTAPIGEKVGYRYFRIQQNGWFLKFDVFFLLFFVCFYELKVFFYSGKNAGGQTHYLSLSGFEIYGKVTDAVEDMGKNVKDNEQSMKK